MRNNIVSAPKYFRGGQTDTNEDQAIAFLAFPRSQEALLSAMISQYQAPWRCEGAAGYVYTSVYKAGFIAYIIACCKHRNCR